MSYGIDGASLDRWITGNYGDDRYLGQHECRECGNWLLDDGDDLVRDSRGTLVCPFCGDEHRDEWDFRLPFDLEDAAAVVAEFAERSDAEQGVPVPSR